MNVSPSHADTYASARAAGLGAVASSRLEVDEKLCYRFPWAEMQVKQGVTNGRSDVKMMKNSKN